MTFFSSGKVLALADQNVGLQGWEIPKEEQERMSRTGSGARENEQNRIWNTLCLVLEVYFDLQMTFKCTKLKQNKTPYYLPIQLLPCLLLLYLHLLLVINTQYSKHKEPTNTHCGGLVF